MRGVSAEGYAVSRDKLEARAADGGDAQQLGDELFSVADLLVREVALRRALTDPTAAPLAKSNLASTVLGDKVSDETVDVVATAAAARWSSTADFVGAVESLGALALVIAAEQAGTLGELEDELFRFGRLVVGEPELRDAITNKQIPAANRQALVAGLLEGKASAPTVRLATQAVSSQHRSFEVALEEFQKVAGDRRQRLIAVVRSAVELNEEERTRLATALRRQYGRKVHLNVVVDPQVLGGIRVDLGDDVIDGTVAGRLDDARRRMAG